MKNKAQSIKFVCLSIIVVILSSLACSIDFGGDTDESFDTEQTLVALQLTQIALENAAEETSPPVEEEPTEEEPTEEEPTPDVDYEGISFSFDPQIGSNVTSETIPMQNMGEDYMPGDTYPTHYEFTFNTYAVSGHFHTAKIIVYPADEYAAISTYAKDIIYNLSQRLISRPSGGVYSAFPFLPMWNAAQIFSAKVHYFDFQNGSGVRFLTMYGQDIYPIDNTNMFYTYQGLTYDERYYISAVFPVTKSDLPSTGEEVIGDYTTFYDNWDSYISDMVDWLNYELPEEFFPNLDLLDELIASIKIER